MQNRETEMLSSNSFSKKANEREGMSFFGISVQVKKCFHFKTSLFKFLFYASVCTSCIGKMPPPEEKTCLYKDVLTKKKIH